MITWNIHFKKSRKEKDNLKKKKTQKKTPKYKIISNVSIFVILVLLVNKFQKTHSNRLIYHH
jgi:fucose permease